MLGSLHSAPMRALLVNRSWPLAWLIWSTTPLFAAEPSPAQSPGLEEITVTAQRRSESLQTVPIAITAVNGAEMERNGIHDLGTLSGQVPGLTFSPYAPGQNIVSLRGVSSNDDGAGTDNSVAVFVDDVYLGRVSNINPEMYDVDRVEVLRGPQVPFTEKTPLAERSTSFPRGRIPPIWTSRPPPISGTTIATISPD